MVSGGPRHRELDPPGGASAGRQSGRAVAQGLPREYSRRWGVETFISGLKRTVASVLQARSLEGQLAEAVQRTLVYSLRR